MSHFGNPERRLAASQKDNRKRVLLPTRRCIDEYQSMVDTLLMLGDVLQEHGQAYLQPAT